jgi:DNA mismatch repair protein MutS
VAAPAEQQPELALQGSLFGEPEAAQPQTPTQTKTTATTLESQGDLEGSGLDEAALAADASSRPRQRQTRAANEPSPSEPSPGPSPAANQDPDGQDANSDLPAWHHHGLVDPEQLTPMLRHYVELKAAHPERVLLYRLGDFFECFFEDAISLSRLLELTLTGKEAGKAMGRVPMAGIPHHAAERYCAELVRRGLSVALCDQLETASAKGPAKGELLKRGITRVLTPGTVLEDEMLSARRNNWLCAVVLSAEGDGTRWGLAVADVSTGEFQVTERQGSDLLHQELLQVEAAEVLWPSAEGIKPPWCPDGLHLTALPRTPFEAPEASATLKSRFGLASLDGLGLQAVPLAMRAAGGLVAYLDATQEGQVPLDLPTTWHAGDLLILDAQTRRNLELTKTQTAGASQGSLLWALDRTHTAMGGRCLRRWVEAPLVDLGAILERQAGVGELVAQRPLRLGVRRLLRPMGDLERLAGRAGAGSASARDLVALADGLERLPQLAALLAKSKSQPLQALAQPWPELETIAALLRHNLLDTPPLTISEGGLIHDGVDPQLDGLRNQLDDQEAWLRGQEALERQTSGIPSLKLQYHRTFGYFLAVSRAKSAAVPDHWIRRQTLANEERFVTPELKAREGKILQLKARAAQREYELFCQLRSEVGTRAAPIRVAARLVAELDAVASLADVAATGGYCCPEITGSRELVIEAGRHPVVEQLLVEEAFTPNDLALGGNGTPDLLVLTGPNASGKSCYLRQAGLLQLMAQMGSWIPAQSARLGIADRIFTRVGAGDDLSSGQSTFMVEMAETANILHHATERSLVLLDEIGRGTATFDGLSIAWAVAEHLAAADGQGIRARSVFATHYHELNELADLLPNVANAQVLVEESGESLVFLHRVAPGGANRSYGIEAARLAGVPPSVVLRARQVLGRIEANSHVAVGLSQVAT